MFTRLNRNEVVSKLKRKKENMLDFVPQVLFLCSLFVVCVENVSSCPLCTITALSEEITFPEKEELLLGRSNPSSCIKTLCKEAFLETGKWTIISLLADKKSAR